LTVNICSSKVERSTGAYRPSWLRTWQQWLMAVWFCLAPFVARADAWTAHAGHEKKNLAWLAKSASNSKMRSLLARSRVSKLRPV